MNNDWKKEKLRKSLVKDFDNLYQKKYTTAWRENRFFRKIEIGIMHLEHTEDFISQEIQKAVEGRDKLILDTLERIMSKDRVKQLGDNLEIAHGVRECKVCGNNPEHQREYLIKEVKHKLEKQK